MTDTTPAPIPTSTMSHDDCETCERQLAAAKAMAGCTGSVGCTHSQIDVDGTEHRAEWQSGRKPWGAE